MLPAPIPVDEPARLAELHALSILDTPREERFDLIVRLARQIFQVPMAYIALIDADRQWFKAKCGVTQDETGREISFCGHAIMQDDLMVIPDARDDWRFQDNPLVVNDPYVRFYAGHPLAGPNGHNVGTLCLADREPRTLSAKEESILRSLAMMAEQQLQLVNLVANQQQLLETQAQLLQTQSRLQAELAEAGAYVRSLLPERINSGPVRADWAYLSSSQLGGDLFGYHWLDADRFAVYLFDVCGHGVGASLLASSVQTALRRQTLPDCDFSQPGQVMTALDAAFPMDKHHDKFFTIWYGVYHRQTRQLRCATAGHHPALLFPSSKDAGMPVGPRDLMIGITTSRIPRDDSLTLTPGSRLYIFSDGAFELRNHSGEMLGMPGLNLILQDIGSVVQERAAAIQNHLTEWTDGAPFADDFSLVEITFD